MDFVVYHKTIDKDSINKKTFDSGITQTLELTELLYGINKNNISVEVYSIEDGCVKTIFTLIIGGITLPLSIISFTETDFFKYIYRERCGGEFHNIHENYNDLTNCFKQLNIIEIENSTLDEKTKEILKNINSKHYKNIKKDKNVSAIAYKYTPEENDLIPNKKLNDYIKEEDKDEETYRIIAYMQSAPVDENKKAIFQIIDDYNNFPIEKNKDFNATFSNNSGFEDIEDFNRHEQYKFDVEILIKKNKSKVITKIISLNDKNIKSSDMKYDEIYELEEKEEKPENLKLF